MKKYKHFSGLLILIFSVALVTSSCNKQEGYDHFIDAELVSNYSLEYINAVLGIVVQAYPEIEEVEPYIGDGIRVSRITYRTVLNGKNIKASGLVSVPATPGRYPVISFQNGTNTLNSNCPSENPEDYFYQLLEYVAAMGFVVVVPDYPGFGSSSDIPHPYLLSEPTVEAVTRMLMAVVEGESEFGDVIIDNEYYLIGYSQGGWATFQTHTYIEESGVYGFNLAGSVCGAGPYDLNNIMISFRNSTTYPVPAYIGYIINAYTYYGYIENEISELLKEPYASRIPSLFDGTHSIDYINSQLTTSIPDLLTENFRAGGQSDEFISVGESLISNSAKPYASQVPLLLIHGDADTQVSVENTEWLYESMLTEGTPVSLCTKIILPGLDHGDGIIPFVIEGLKFIIDLRDN